MATEMVLGPSLSNVFEPIPGMGPPPPVAGRRGIQFQASATTPGGRVNVQFLPAVLPNDALPLNVYAFFVQPVSSVPVGAALAPAWFFSSGAPSSSAQSASRDPNDNLTVVVPNVAPSLQPYFVQTVLEYSL